MRIGVWPRFPIAFCMMARAVWNNRIWLPDIDSAPGWMDEEDDVTVYLAHGADTLKAFRHVRKTCRSMGFTSQFEIIRRGLLIDF